MINQKVTPFATGFQALTPRTTPHIPAQKRTFCTLYAPCKGQFPGAVQTMILQIDDNYRISTDEYNFILQKG